MPEKMLRFIPDLFLAIGLVSFGLWRVHDDWLFLAAAIACGLWALIAWATYDQEVERGNRG